MRLDWAINQNIPCIPDINYTIQTKVKQRSLTYEKGIDIQRDELRWINEPTEIESAKIYLNRQIGEIIRRVSSYLFVYIFDNSI